MSRSSSISFFNFSSSSCYYSTSSVALFASLYSIYFLLILANVSGFDSLIQLLPPSASFSRKSETIFRVDDFGAAGDGFTDDTNSFKDVWDMACSSPSRSKIVIPDGYVFLVRPINFAGPCRSKVSLRALTFHRCNNLKVRNIKLFNSQQMHLRFNDCKNVAASKLIILAPADSPNTDAIHISSSIKVNVKDCTIGTGDDCISIVGNSSRIKVNKIVCGPGHGISIGSLGKSNSRGQVSNVHVNGAFISNTENGVRIKTWQGGSGFVRKITFKNVWMENVSNPIIIDQYYCDSTKPCSNKTSNIRIDKVSFVGIKGTSATEKAITIACSDSFPCKKLYLEDVQLTSSSGDYTTSFCWQAYGSTSGLNYPPPCFPFNDKILQPTVLSNWIPSM